MYMCICIYTYYTYIYKYLHTYIHIYTYIHKRKRAILGGSRPPIQVQSCTVSFALGAMHPAFVQMYRAEVTDVLARLCPAMSSEMAHFALMKCNKIKLPGYYSSLDTDPLDLSTEFYVWPPKGLQQANSRSHAQITETSTSSLIRNRHS